MLKLTLRNNRWYVTGSLVRRDGRKIRLRKSTGFSKYQKPYAEEALSRIILEAHKGSDSEPTVRIDKVVDLFLNRPNPPGKTDVIVLNNFKAEFGSVMAMDLKSIDIHQYVNGRGNKAGTVKRELGSITAMLNYGRDMGMGIPMIKLKKPYVDDGRERWLTCKERDVFILSCCSRIRRIVTFLFFTGARLGEAFKLRRKDVQADGVVLSSRKGQGGKKKNRMIPMTDVIRRSIFKIDKIGPYIFLSPQGKKWNPTEFYKHWGKACEKAGQMDFHPHDCRHTFASLLVQNGAGLKAVQELLGHSKLEMVMRYAHLSPTALKDTMELMHEPKLEEVE